MSNKIRPITPKDFVRKNLLGILPQPKTPQNGVSPLASPYRRENEIDVQPSYGGIRSANQKLIPPIIEKFIRENKLPGQVADIEWPEGIHENLTAREVYEILKLTGTRYNIWLIVNAFKKEPLLSEFELPQTLVNKLAREGMYDLSSLQFVYPRLLEIKGISTKTIAAINEAIPQLKARGN